MRSHALFRFLYPVVSSRVIHILYIIQVLTLTPYYMITNVGQKTISIREELSDVPPDAAGWFAWARGATPEPDAEARKSAEDEGAGEGWLVVEPGKVIPFWPSARNKKLELVARSAIVAIAFDFDMAITTV